jgi:hypothetical protein
MVIIQKQGNNRRSGRAHNHQEQKRHGRSRVQQSMLIVFLDVKGIVHGEFVPNTMVNSNFYSYCDVCDA